MVNELYAEHKVQAIDEFTLERLQAFYLANSRVMRPAVDAIQEGGRLRAAGHRSAALVFFVTAIEVLLKATILEPVVHGLVHRQALAEVIVNQVFNGASGYVRYRKLLARLFAEYAGMEVDSIVRDGAKESLLSECSNLQTVRNRIVHQGETCTEEQAELGNVVAIAVYEKIVKRVLHALELTVIEDGEITKKWW